MTVFWQYRDSTETVLIQYWDSTETTLRQYWDSTETVVRHHNTPICKHCCAHHNFCWHNCQTMSTHTHLSMSWHQYCFQPHSLWQQLADAPTPLHHSAACPPPSSWMPRVCCQRVFAARADHISRENKLMFSTFFFFWTYSENIFCSHLFLGDVLPPRPPDVQWNAGGLGSSPQEKYFRQFFICEVGGCGTNCCCLLFALFLFGLCLNCFVCLFLWWL